MEVNGWKQNGQTTVQSKAINDKLERRIEAEKEKEEDEKK